MTLGNQLVWDDTVLPFQLDASDIRGRVARMIATDYYGPTEEGEPARIRAYASYDADRLTDGAPFENIGEGYFAIIIDQGQDMAPYQGISPLVGPTLSASAEAYFAQSEQLPTRFQLSFGQSTEGSGDAHWRAGGVMLQHMPEASPLMAKAPGEGDILKPTDLLHGDKQENWNRVNILLDTVEELELIGPHVPPNDLLTRLFHEELPRVFDPQAVRFGCTCSEDRVRQSLSIYSARDIETMTTDDGRVTADCQFCGAHYDLDPKTVGFDAEQAPSDD